MSARAKTEEHPMIGACEAFRRLERELAQVAPSDVTVLIRGESGSGKNLAARVLHERSARAAGPRVEVHLAALAPTLLEAELFGHEPGAFTGARAARRGRFELADGGTLVLDGIEGLPLEIQPKLLRVLQEREVEPLGAEVARPIDVRIVATSAASLAGRVREGRFREDLYYRLAVVEIEVPPLRARLDDLPALGAALLARGAERHGVPLRRISDGALERLRAHAWPGNLRELENALERVLLLPAEPGAGAPIAAAELVFLSEAAEGVPGRLAREALAHGIDLPALERALCELALREAHGNLAAAARVLGLTRRAF
jgi:two-component system response regulator HydG